MRLQRKFILGSEWGYLKIYTGSNIADKILLYRIEKIITTLNKNELISQWFFIRYSDPDFHLRVRFLLNTPSSLGKVIEICNKYLSPLVRDRVIWKIQFDTYNREIERYHEHLMELSESLFCIDSCFTLKLLKLLMKDVDVNVRWLISIVMVDRLLDDFEYETIEKRKILSSLNHSFKAEFGFNQNNSKQFNTLYRQYSKDIYNAISLENYYRPYKRILNARSKRLKIVADKIMKVDGNENKDTLLSSYIHMMLNRIFRSKNRIYELVIYDFMYRYYESEIARDKYNLNI